MKNKDIKHDIKVALGWIAETVKQNNKDLNNNNITLYDSLVALIDNTESSLKTFKELLDQFE